MFDSLNGLLWLTLRGTGIITSCAILPTMHTELCTCTLAYSHPLHNYTPRRHSALLTTQSSAYKTTHMLNSNKSSQHNSHLNMLYRCSTAHRLHSFCIQHLLCSVATKLQPPTTWLLHAHQHPLHTHAALYPPHCLPQPAYACKQHTQGIASWQNGTRCRDGVKVMWCHSHLVWLVFEGPILTCACFHSENFFVTRFLPLAIWCVIMTALDVTMSWLHMLLSKGTESDGQL